jgi:transposase
LVSERTALINHLRALLLERGIVAPQGRRKLEIEGLTPRIRVLIEDLRAEWRALDERIAVFDKEFIQMAWNEEAVRRLATIPGIGTINATALAAAVGKARAFRRGRDMAAWTDSPPDDDRRQAALARHQQARQPVSSKELDPRRACRAALPG